MIEELKQNIETEIEILREISNNVRRLDYSNPSERKLLETSIESLKSSMKLINNSIPKLLEDVTGVKKLPQKEQKTSLEKVEFRGLDSTIHVTVEAKDRERLLRELSISENLVKRLKVKQFSQEEKYDEIKSARGYLKLSNKIFLDLAQRLIKKGYFKPLAVQLKKANIDVLFAAYVAMMIFTTLLALILSVFVLIFFTIFSVHISSPYIEFFSGNFLIRLLEFSILLIAIPLVVFFAIYYYHTTEKDSLSRKIDRELPFAVIHMSAISGSGIEPSEIFKIIGLNKEYPYLRKEIRKVLNQINLYGYDLVTALNNISKTTPSSKLAELFSGVSTTITSGSSLQNFFEKRAESLLITYRLEREKYTKLAETFMDIYISIVIAAPMILMILLVMISVLNIQTGFSTNELTFLMISMIAIINAVFIAVLHVKQPNY